MFSIMRSNNCRLRKSVSLPEQLCCQRHPAWVHGSFFFVSVLKIHFDLLLHSWEGRINRFVSSLSTVATSKCVVHYIFFFLYILRYGGKRRIGDDQLRKIYSQIYRRVLDCRVYIDRWTTLGAELRSKESVWKERTELLFFHLVHFNAKEKWTDIAFFYSLLVVSIVRLFLLLCSCTFLAHVLLSTAHTGRLKWFGTNVSSNWNRCKWSHWAKLYWLTIKGRFWKCTFPPCRFLHPLPIWKMIRVTEL